MSEVVTRDVNLPCGGGAHIAAMSLIVNVITSSIFVDKCIVRRLLVGLISGTEALWLSLRTSTLRIMCANILTMRVYMSYVLRRNNLVNLIIIK